MLSCNTIVCRQPFRSYSHNFYYHCAQKYSLVYRFPFIVENPFQGILCLYIPALKGDQLTPLDTRGQSGSPAYIELTFTYAEAAEHVLKKFRVCSFPHLCRGRQNTLSRKTLTFPLYLSTSLHKLLFFSKHVFRVILKTRLLLTLRNLFF